MRRTGYRVGLRASRRRLNNSIARCAIAGALALLATGVGGAVLAVPAQAATAATITLQLSKASIVADGVDSATATATVMDSTPAPLPGETVTFSAPGDVVSGTTDHGDGTYSASITSTTADATSVTASDGALTSTGTTLTRTAPVAASVALQLSKGSIVADGVDSATATATVMDSTPAPLSGETVTFSAPGDGVNPLTCMTGVGGTCSVSLTSTTVGSSSVTASDGGVTSAGLNLARTPGPATHIDVHLSPSAVIANGTSTTTATAMVTDAEGHAVPGDNITFFPGGEAADHGNGTYTAIIKSTTTPGQVPIEAFDNSDGASGGATLTQQQGTASTSTDLVVASTNPLAGQTVTLIATVTSDQSNIPPTGAITFESGGKPISGCVRSVAPTSQSVTVFCQTSFAASTANLMVAFTPSSTASVSGSASPTTTIEIGKSPTHSVIRGAITAQMQWSFDHSLRSTKPLVFVIGGVRVGATVTVQCHGHGCPYAKSATTIKRPKSCKQTKKHKCPVTHPGTINLMRRFHNHHLQVGAKVTIKITQPSVIGKYYTFVMRAGKGPRISIGCIAPGSNRLGVGC